MAGSETASSETPAEGTSTEGTPEREAVSVPARGISVSGVLGLGARQADCKVGTVSPRRKRVRLLRHSTDVTLPEVRPMLR